MTVRCLIIDRNPVLRKKLGKFIETFRDDFQFQTVGDVNEAIDAIAHKEFSLVLCEPSLADPKTGLVPYIMDNTPALSLLITRQDESPFSNKLNTLDCVKSFIARPMRPADIAGKVVLALDYLFFQGKVRAVNCITLIQIFEQECNDGILRVYNTKEEMEGLLFIKKGVLLDAICGPATGLEAVKRVFRCDSMDIDLYNICPPMENRIKLNMTSLIIQCVDQRQACEYPSSQNGEEVSSKSTKKSVGGLAGLFLNKTKKK